MLSVILAAVLVDRYELGIVGLCVGFIAGRSVLSLAYPWMVGRVLGASLSRQARSALRPASVAALLTLGATWLGNALTVNTWLGLVLGSGVTLALVSSLALFAGLSGPQRARILTRLTSSSRDDRSRNP